MSILSRMCARCRIIGNWMKRYVINLLLALDQLGNALGAGDVDETISSRLGRIKRRRGGRIPWSRPVSKIVDACLEWIDPGHTIDAIEEDEGAGGLVDKPIPKGP